MEEEYETSGPIADYQIIDYPDGGSYVKMLDTSVTEIAYRINTYKDLCMLKSIKDAHPKLETVFIPCLFQQQHDRRFNNNESFELKLVCDFINSCNFKKVKLFHPHSDVAPALINNCEVISNYDFINRILESRYGSIYEASKQCILMSTDQGGYKALMKLCDELDWTGDTASAIKSRKFVNFKSEINLSVDRTNFNGKDVLVIDDICVYGGTAVKIGNILKANNTVKKLMFAVSHITVNNPNPELENIYDTVYTTNSKFKNASDINLNNIKRYYFPIF